MEGMAYFSELLMLVNQFLSLSQSQIIVFCAWHLSVRKITKSSSTFSATNFSSNIIELLQLHDTIQIKWIYA